MPILIAMAGALIAGVSYWIRYGNGMEHIDHTLRDWRKTRLRAKSEAERRAAPLRSLSDPADAAGVLMDLVARTRGIPTPEQNAAVEAQMRMIVSANDDLAARMVFIRHAATHAKDAASATDELAPLLREKLIPSERNDLEHMLRVVAAVHDGPTLEQENLIARIKRALAEQR